MPESDVLGGCFGVHVLYVGCVGSCALSILRLEPNVLARGGVRQNATHLRRYDKGLALAPTNQELKDGLQRCTYQLNRFMTGQASEEEIKERQARAMADPEIQHIMTDPMMQQVRVPRLRRC